MKLKKLMASCLAAAMVMGLGATAFATNGAMDSSGTVSQLGSGASEGYVNKTVANLILPTASATTFSFKVDPQRLVTASARSDMTLSSDAASKGVYFMQSGGTYDSSSDALYFVNKSTYNVKLKVTAQATGGDMTLSSNGSVTLDSGATAPKLALGLKVGNDTKYVSTSAMTSGAEKVIEAVASNYGVSLDSAGNYEYAVTDDTTATWNAIKIQLTGEVTDMSAVSASPDKAYTAPTSVSVTWTWEKAAANDTVATDVVGYQNGAVVDAVSGGSGSSAPSIAVTNYSATLNTPINITLNYGSDSSAATGVSSVKYLNKSGVEQTVALSSGYSISGTTLTLTAATVNAFVNSSNSTRTYTITFNDTASTTVDVTLTK